MKRISLFIALLVALTGCSKSTENHRPIPEGNEVPYDNQPPKVWLNCRIQPTASFNMPTLSHFVTITLGAEDERLDRLMVEWNTEPDDPWNSGTPYTQLDAQTHEYDILGPTLKTTYIRITDNGRYVLNESITVQVPEPGVYPTSPCLDADGKALSSSR